MPSCRTLFVVGLVVASAFVVGTTVAAPTDMTALSLTNAPEDTDETNTSIGQEVSSFMQVSAAETDGTVDAGMWEAGVADLDNETKQADRVEERVELLHERATQLQEEKRAIREARNNGSISQIEYQARMSQIVGELSGLQEDIKRTKSVGEKSGANLSKLDDVQNQTANVAGPELEAVARSPGIGTAAINASKQGPSEDGPNDEPAATGNVTAGNQSNDSSATRQADGDGPGASDDAGNDANAGGPADADAADDFGSDNGASDNAWRSERPRRGR